MKICGGAVTNWRESLGPHASCVHQLSLVHARCVRSQAPTANGSRSYFHWRHQDTKNLMTSLPEDRQNPRQQSCAGRTHSRIEGGRPVMKLYTVFARWNFD